MPGLALDLIGSSWFALLSSGVVAQISESSPVVGLVFVVVCFNGLFLITCMWGLYEYSVHRGFRFLGAEITAGCEPPSMSSGN